MHGYLADGNSFYKQKAYFEKYFKVYAPDLKGFGKNADMEFPYSLIDYVNDVRLYIERNNIRGADVIAHSFGGRIAIKLACKDEGVFGKIVLTGAAGVKPRFSISKKVKGIVFKTLKKFTKKEKLLKFYSEDYKRLSPVMRKSFIKIVNEHLDEKAKLITNKTLIINGKKDRETPPYTAKKLNKYIKNSRLVFIKNAGHFAFIDRADIFNITVKQFLLEE